MARPPSGPLAVVRNPYENLLSGPVRKDFSFLVKVFGHGFTADLTVAQLHAMPHYIADIITRLRVACHDYGDVLAHFPNSFAAEFIDCLRAQCDAWDACQRAEKWLMSLHDKDNALLAPYVSCLAELSSDEKNLVAAWTDWLERVEAEVAHEKALIQSVTTHIKKARKAKKAQSPPKRKCREPDSPEGTPIPVLE